MKTYRKPALKIGDLYDKLIERQLVVPAEDKQIVFNSLERIGYYRLTGYCLPFLCRTGNQRVFTADATIQRILALYEFDTNLRSLSLQVLEKIEIALAASICNTLCLLHGPLWYSKEAIFLNSDIYWKSFNKAIDFVKFDWSKNRGKPENPNLFLKHYYSTYSHPKLPPAWMLRECASFGFWSSVYQGLQPKEKQAISSLWKYPNKKPIASPVFESWLHTLSVFRNRCAHHNRITNLTLPYDPKIPDNISAAKRFISGKTNNLRTIFLVIDILLRTAAPHSEWKNWLRAQFESAVNVSISKATGFNTIWHKDDFWLEWVAPPKS